MSRPTFILDDANDLSPPPRVIIINGGRTKMYFWIVIQYPARVQAAAPARITKLSSPRWTQPSGQVVDAGGSMPCRS